MGHWPLFDLLKREMTSARSLHSGLRGKLAGGPCAGRGHLSVGRSSVCHHLSFGTLSSKMTVSTSTFDGTESITGDSKPHIRELKLKEHVGFATLPEQYVNRTIRDGFAFNILVVGSTGVGKSTLVESLFNFKFPESSAKTHLLKNVDLHVQKQELQEKNIKMRLSVAETRGYGDQINKGKPIVSPAFNLYFLYF